MACINCSCENCQKTDYPVREEVYFRRDSMAPRPRRFDPVADVEEFHRNFGLEYKGKPRVMPTELQEFRKNFLKEEYEEYSEHMYKAIYFLVFDKERIPFELEEMADALVDLVYVALGNAYMHGFNFREMWRRVHEANMKKERAVRIGDSKRGTLYDVVKPPGWVAPTHLDLVQDHAHQGDINEP